MKKALSIVLALVLCLSMSVMAFAENTEDTAADPGAATAQSVDVESKEDTTEAATEAAKTDLKTAAEDLIAKAKEAAKDVADNLKKKDEEKATEATEKATEKATEEETKENKVAEAFGKAKEAVEDLKENEEVSKVVEKASEVVEEVKNNEKVAEVGEKAKSVFSELLNTASDWEGLKAMLNDVDPEALNDVLKTTGESISKITNGKINLDLDGSLDSIFNGLKGIAEDKDLADVMPAVSDTFMDLYKKLGGDENKLIEKLQNSKLLNLPVSIYGYAAIPATVPVPENPKTGSTAAIAVFAVLSVAAAAAFVCSKKED